jgi:N-terminal domain of (some) glycogen debranching enzymes
VVAEPADGTAARPERERLEARRQPSLHRLVVCLRAPSQVWSDADGQVRAEGAHGVYLGDVRVLSSAVLTLDNEEPEPLTTLTRAADEAVFVGLAPPATGSASRAVRRCRHRRIGRRACR